MKETEKAAEAPPSENLRRRRPVIYEAHPVSPERKEYLQSKGFRILDARFAPEDYEYPEEHREQAESAAKSKPKGKGK